MKDISLKDLLEAGCHFGHKVEKWHPKAKAFIYGEREGIHIIDLAKTRDGLKKAVEFLHSLGKEKKVVLFVATKRQAKSVVTEAAKRAGLSYLTSRWVGGFLTNWEEVKKNIDKTNRMGKELVEGVWKKFPKHEQVQLEKELRKLESVYHGVKELAGIPDAVFMIDIKREVSALRESTKRILPVVAIIDTNADPNLVDYPIPANDDAVGSIQYIVDALSDAYLEGKKVGEKTDDKQQITDNKEQTTEDKKPVSSESKEEKPKEKKVPKKLKKLK